MKVISTKVSEVKRDLRNEDRLTQSSFFSLKAEQELAWWKWIPWIQSKGCGILEQYEEGFFHFAFRKQSKTLKTETVFSLLQG